MRKAETYLQQVERHTCKAEWRITGRGVLIPKPGQGGWDGGTPVCARSLNGVAYQLGRLLGASPRALAAGELTVARRTFSAQQSDAGATKLPGPFRPLRPDLDEFLFAEVGDETDGMPLSVISALTRLGLDPWEEADRLSSLGNREALDQLAQLIAELAGNSHRLREGREIASSLVSLLPKHNPSPASPPQVQIRLCYRRSAVTTPKLSQFWVVCLVLAAAALVSALLHGGFPFGIGGQ